MNDFTKEENKNNVTVIYDAKKEAVNFSWGYYCKYPKMKKYLVHEKNDDQFVLRDIRTDKIVMSGSTSLEDFLK